MSNDVIHLTNFLVVVLGVEYT